MRMIRDIGRPRTRHWRGGLTLVEAMISIVVVAIMMTSAVGMLGSTVRTRKVQMGLMQAPALAAELMSEIMAVRYYDPDDTTNWGRELGESTATREAFDDLDDYDGYTSSPPKDKRGLVIPGCSGWTESVTVRKASLSDPMVTSGSATGLRRITVTITDDRGAVTTLVALRCKDRDSAFEPGDSAANINCLLVRADVSGSGSLLVSGVNLLNQPGGQPSVDGSPGNNPPRAVVSAAPTAGPSPLTVSFSAVGSSDPDAGDQLTYQWNFGDAVTATGITASHTYPVAGSYVATCTVTDKAGVSDVASVTIMVGAVSPPESSEQQTKTKI